MAAHAGFAYDDTIYSHGGRARGRGTVWQFTSIDTIGDITAPTLTVVSPTLGANLGRTAPIVVQIEDDRGFSIRDIWARFSDANQWESVYTDGEFTSFYERSDVETELGDPGPEYFERLTFSIARSGGWPLKGSSPQVVLRFTVVDSAGNILVLSS